MEGDDKGGRRDFKSSRDGLRRSLSSPALLPRASSAQRLWGSEYDPEDGEDKTLERILRENKGECSFPAACVF